MSTSWNRSDLVHPNERHYESRRNNVVRDCSNWPKSGPPRHRDDLIVAYYNDKNVFGLHSFILFFCLLLYVPWERMKIHVPDDINIYKCSWGIIPNVNLDSISLNKYLGWVCLATYNIQFHSHVQIVILGKMGEWGWRTIEWRSHC